MKLPHVFLPALLILGCLAALANDDESAEPEQVDWTQVTPRDIRPSVRVHKRKIHDGNDNKKKTDQDVYNATMKVTLDNYYQGSLIDFTVELYMIGKARINRRRAYCVLAKATEAGLELPERGRVELMPLEAQVSRDRKEGILYSDWIVVVKDPEGNILGKHTKSSGLKKIIDDVLSFEAIKYDGKAIPKDAAFFNSEAEIVRVEEEKK